MSAARIARAYRGLALLAWNSFLVLVAMNLLAALLLALGVAAPPPPGSLRYGLERLSAVHPGREGDEIAGLLTETWTREYVYAPWVQHREGPMRGRWVNVDPAGFRLSARQGPWPPAADELTVFHGVRLRRRRL